jgi:hypothetical protein
MDHPEIEERQVVERYLAGSLGAAEEERFEEHYLSCPQCLEQLELSQAWRDGLRHAAAEDALRSTAAGRLGLAAWLARAARTPRGVRLLAAALVVLTLSLGTTLVGLGVLSQRNSALAGRLAAARAPQPNPLILPLSPERGGADEPPAARLTLPQRPGWIVLSLELERPAYASYRVTLNSPGGETRWRGDGLTPDSRDSLTVALHSTDLSAGDHELRVAGQTADGTTAAVGRFAFRVVPGSP